MQLLTEQELIWSAVVANTSMNRKRTASGINSYEQEFKFRPEDLLAERIRRNGTVRWLDLCCGEGNALIQAALFLEEEGLQSKARLEGIDLVDYFSPVPDPIRCIEFRVQSLADWQPDGNYDLITCVHGLHYIGDKLGMLGKVLEVLGPEGLFVANFDMRSVCLPSRCSPGYLKDLFKSARISYNGRRKVISCTGPRTMDTGLRYLGADDKAGPNYTGQEAVNSYYE